MTHTEYMRVWRNNNRERYREITNKATAKWRRLHPAAVKAKVKQDQERLFGGNRAKVFERDKHRCAECGRKTMLSIDHKNGDRTDNRMRNLQTLCLKCHGHKDGLRGWKWVSPNHAVRAGA